MKKYGPDAVQELEELAYELKLERLRVYGKNEFLLSLKKLYEEKKEEAEQEQEKESTYSAIIKSIFHRKNNGEFQEAAAVLDSIIA